MISYNSIILEVSFNVPFEVIKYSSCVVNLSLMSQVHWEHHQVKPSNLPSNPGLMHFMATIMKIYSNVGSCNAMIILFSQIMQFWVMRFFIEAWKISYSKSLIFQRQKALYVYTSRDAYFYHANIPIPKTNQQTTKLLYYKTFHKYIQSVEGIYVSTREIFID